MFVLLLKAEVELKTLLTLLNYVAQLVARGTCKTSGVCLIPTGTITTNMKIYSASQTFGHTYSLQGFSLF
jgi:hypothetical protein